MISCVSSGSMKPSCGRKPPTTLIAGSSRSEKSLNGVLALPDGGIRRDEAQKYLREVIPQRMHELDLFTKAKQAVQKDDQASLTNAASLLDQVVSLQGPRRSEAEQLRRQVQDKLANLSAQQQQKQRNQQQAADLETSTSKISHKAI